MKDNKKSMLLTLRQNVQELFLVNQRLHLSFCYPFKNAFVIIVIKVLSIKGNFIVLVRCVYKSHIFLYMHLNGIELVSMSLCHFRYNTDGFIPALLLFSVNN